MSQKEAAQLDQPQNLSYGYLSTWTTLQSSRL